MALAGVLAASAASRIAQVNLKLVSKLTLCRFRPHSLVSLRGVLERRENVGVGPTLDTVDKARYLGEERVVVGVDVSLLVVVSRSSDVQRGGLVWVDQPHVVAIGPDLKLACVGRALESDSVGERANGAIVVFPEQSRQFSPKVDDASRLTRRQK